jgi:O-antigen/teichoic acid export membrane protein
MKPAITTDIGSTHSSFIDASLLRLKALRGLSYLGHPAAYAIGAAVVTALSAGTTFVAPMLLGPESFGTFALLTTFFQLTARSDFGLSQLADRELALGTNNQYGAHNILEARLLLGGVLLIAVAPVIVLTMQGYAGLSAIDIAITIIGGIAAMIAVGPVTIYRASSKLWEFTALALSLQLAMTFPRLMGLYIGGTTGCFAVLLVWYASFALLFANPGRIRYFNINYHLKLLRSALPLFIFSTLWLVYLFANRWISSSLSNAWDFGLFAFGANLAYIVIGTVGAIGQAFYPKLISEIGRTPQGSGSKGIFQQTQLILIGLSIPLAASLPFASFLINYIFPKFSLAVDATILLSVSAVPLSIVTWLLPVSIALSKRPLREAILVMVPAFFFLILFMYFGNLLAGIIGQAIANTLSGTLIILLLLGLLWLQGALNPKQAFILMAMISMVVGFLTLEASQFMVRPLEASQLYGGQPISPIAAQPHQDPKSGMRLVFAEEFDRLRLIDDRDGGVWEPAYPWGARSNTDNHELEYYVDPRSGREAEPLKYITPFKVKNGILSLSALKAEADQLKAAHGLPYLSGMLNTSKSFSFTYGYVEMRARLPHGGGLWPALWLLPLHGGWPPEIDVMEEIGSRTDRYYGSVHSLRNGTRSETVIPIDTVDLAKNYNTFGMKWDTQSIDWFLNGLKVATAPTPSDISTPMYLLLNLAIGGNWAGQPDENTVFPAHFDVDYIKVYSFTP